MRALDVRHALRFLDANDREAVIAELPQLATADLDDAMYLVDGRGRVYRGFHAFRRIAQTTPLLWLFLPLLHAPGMDFLGERVYALVARNRRRLGCQIDTPGRC